MSTSVHDFLFHMIPADKRVLSFDDSFGIYENLDSDKNGSVDISSFEHLEHLPAKLRFTLGIYCHKGNIFLSANLRDYSMAEGDILICSSGTIISNISFSDECRLAIFCVNNNNDIDRHISAGTGILVTATGIGPLHINLRESFREPLKQLCRMLNRWLSEDNFDMRSEAFYSTLQTMIVIVAASLPKADNKHTTKVSRAMQLYRRFIEEVDCNYRNRRDLSFYADRCCVTSKYLGKIVHDISGRRPADIIRDHVILDAKAMLRSGRYSVRDIADELHFSTPSFFCRYFRDAVGCSPLHFKN